MTLGPTRVEDALPTFIFACGALCSALPYRSWAFLVLMYLRRGDLSGPGPGDLAPGDLAPGDLAPGDLAPGDLGPR